MDLKSHCGFLPSEIKGCIHLFLNDTGGNVFALPVRQVSCWGISHDQAVVNQWFSTFALENTPNRNSFFSHYVIWYFIVIPISMFITRLQCKFKYINEYKFGPFGYFESWSEFSVCIPRSIWDHMVMTDQTSCYWNNSCMWSQYCRKGRVLMIGHGQLSDPPLFWSGKLTALFPLVQVLSTSTMTYSIHIPPRSIHPTSFRLLGLLYFFLLWDQAHSFAGAPTEWVKAVQICCSALSTALSRRMGIG